MTPGQIVAVATLTVICGYIFYRTRMLYVAEKEMRRATGTADDFNGRAAEAMKRTLDNTFAIEQNTEALRELIAINRQLLDKQDQTRS